MNDLLSAGLALDALRNVESDSVESGDALKTIAGVISDNLDRIEAVKNSQNAGQIANMLMADLFPKDPLSGFILRCIESGSLPDLSDDAPDPRAIYRGCAIFVASVRDSYSDDAPKAGARAVYDLIEKLGYLPSEFRE